MRKHRSVIPTFSLGPLLLAAWLHLLSGPAVAQPLDLSTPAPATANATAVTPAPGTLYLNNRSIATFRATLLGDSPTERVRRCGTRAASRWMRRCRSRPLWRLCCWRNGSSGSGAAWPGGSTPR